MQDTLSQAFAALADPTRRAMLVRLSRGEANVSDLAEPFLKHMSLPAITKHIQVLEKAGFVTKSVNAQYLPCKINGEAFRDVTDWMDQYRVFWEESFDRLELYLKTVSPRKKSGNVRTKEKSKTTTKANTKGKGKRNARKQE